MGCVTCYFAWFCVSQRSWFPQGKDNDTPSTSLQLTYPSRVILFYILTKVNVCLQPYVQSNLMSQIISHEIFSVSYPAFFPSSCCLFVISTHHRHLTQFNVSFSSSFYPLLATMILSLSFSLSISLSTC